MNQHFHRLLLITLLVGLQCGCHCVPLTEEYCDKIDDISDRRHNLDRWYHPRLDLTRLGRSDGAACCRGRQCR